MYMFGANSRCRADRAKEVFGWEPKGSFLWEVLEEDLVKYKGNNPMRDYYPMHMEGVV